ncbi:MAG: isocitrate lyase/PEP mutase family protein [Rhodovarius sp.]|nr:isocitrate lyase/PEP mutase family protein [Rhodovarius sp.]
MRWSERRAMARAVLEGGGCVHPASVHDPISARIAEDLGFELGMLAGSTASLAVLGAPDIILLTLTEFAEQALRINRAVTRLPLLVDADHGYGNALNVMRTVEELEIAGVAALSIEDTDLPRPYGHAKPRLIALEEGVAKMRAAVAARSDPALIVLARTGACSILGLGEAAARVRAYNETGVDGIFLTGVTTREELDALAAEARLPLVLGTLSPAIADPAYLASRGVRIALQGHLPFQAAVAAIHATLQALRAGTPPALIQGLAPAALLKALMREEEYDDRARRFLG